MKGEKSVPQQDLGTKRVCLACQTRFYDLKRKPAVCPKCETVCDVGAFYKAKRSRVVVKEDAPTVAVADELEEFETDTSEPDTEDTLIEDPDDLEEDENVVGIVKKRDEDQ